MKKIAAVVIVMPGEAIIVQVMIFIIAGPVMIRVVLTVLAIIRFLLKMSWLRVVGRMNGLVNIAVAETGLSRKNWLILVQLGLALNQRIGLII
jgi:hypothetical protein